MRIKTGLMLSVVLTFLTHLPLTAQENEVAVTVYNQNLALVRDVRIIDIKKGEQQLYFKDVAAQIDPTSVHLRSLTKADALQILEQNFEYDLVSPDKILRKYIDHEIMLLTSNQDTISGKLLNSGGELVLALPSGEIRLIQNRDIKWLNFPRLPEGLITRPTLIWTIMSDENRKHRVETEYLTHGMNWHTEYVGVLNDSEKQMDITAWVSVENQSGAGYKNAKLKLVAGDIHLAEAAGGRYERPKVAIQAMAQEAVSEKEFFEYHLYTVSRPTSINNNQVKQITLFDAPGIAVNKKYIFDAQRWSDQVRIYTRFQNSEENNLGMPFPAGKFRVYKKDSDGSMIFLGEDRINHIPKDEWIETFLGMAFDIKGERTQIQTKTVGKNSMQQSYEIELRNHKKQNVTIAVTEHFYYRQPQSEWNIVEYSQAYTKKDARTVEFMVTVGANQTKKITYTVEYTW